MKNRAIAILIGVLAAAAAVAIVIGANETQPATPAGAARQAADPASYFDQGAATDDRILALEAAVAEERNARMLLEEELWAIYEQLESLQGEGDAGREQRIAELSDDPQRFQERRAQRAAGDAARRTERLLEAGFSPERADWLIKRESELQMQQMQAVFDARQNGERLDRNDIRLDPERALRTEIGDIEYEQFLEANGRSTSVAVGTVLESSPGQMAGLQSGDEIVSYNGARVFSYGELNSLTMAAKPGESVVVDIMRDGVPMQVVVEAGPIGISNRGFRGRR